MAFFGQADVEFLPFISDKYPGHAGSIRKTFVDTREARSFIRANIDDMEEAYIIYSDGRRAHVVHNGRPVAREWS